MIGQGKRQQSLAFPSKIINYSASPVARPLKRLAHKYLDFVGQPGVARLLAVAVLGRMPIGMVGFSMLMYLQQALGNFALAGTAVGVSFIAMAAAAPVQGRVIDRFGPRGTLWVTGVVQPLALVGVLVAASESASFATVAAFAALSGAFASPITTLTRTMWRLRFEGEDERRTAFALDSVSIELNYTAGPAIVAATLAAFGAFAAFTLAIAAVVLSFAVYVGSGVLALLRRVEATERHLLGPLTEPRLWLVFVATFGLTVGFGLLEVGYPAFATLAGQPALAGVLLAISAIGSAVGGMLYGAMFFRAPMERQFAATLGLMALPLCLHAIFLHPVAFAVVAFFAGALIAPAITAQSVLVSRLAPAQYATEAFTWSSTFIVAGMGAGMALGGVIVEATGVRPAFAAGAAILAAMALLALYSLAPRPLAAPAE